MVYRKTIEPSSKLTTLTIKLPKYQSRNTMLHAPNTPGIQQNSLNNRKKWFLFFVAWAIFATLYNMAKNEPAQPVLQHHPAPNSITADLKAQMALVINLSGQLCATVTDITRISGDLYRTNCTRYRDGTGTATYEVNAATGVVK